MRNSASAAWILALAVLAGSAFAEPRTYTVYRAASAPRLDGSLDDACWRDVPWETGFTLIGGKEVGPRFQTQFAMVWDDRCLYVAVRALEPEMDRLVARAPRGSNDLFGDDRIEIFLGSESDRAHGHQFVMNSRGRGLDFTWEAKKVAGRRLLPESEPWRWACSQKGACWEVGIAIPFAALNIEPREGAALAGNIVRARAVEQPEQYRTTWTPQAAEIAEPEEFGELRLAGLPPPEAAERSLAVAGAGDRVTTLLGDRFKGSVVGLGEDGWLRLSAPEFPHELRLSAQLLDRVELASEGAPGSGDRVTLANGDCVMGEIRSIGAERAVVWNERLGELHLPAASLSEIRLGAAARECLDTSFDLGDAAPWMIVEGKWTLEDGRLVAAGPGVIAAALPQDGPVTFEADVAPIENTVVKYETVLFASQSSRPALRSGVVFHYEEDLGLFRVWNRPPLGKGNWVQAFKEPRSARGGRFRCSYDPKDGAVRAWHDQAVEGPYTARDAPKEGRYVLFIARSPLAVTRLRVLPGIVPPGGESGPEAGTVRVTLANGDVTSARALTFSDGRFAITTEFGQSQVAPGGVASVRFPARDAETVGGGNAMIRVATTEGRLTFSFFTLSAERLSGRSAIFGAVSIPRDCVRSIVFR